MGIVTALCLLPLSISLTAFAQDSDVSGRVTDSKGQPLSEALVIGLHHGGEIGYIDIRVQTDRDGRYQLTSVGKVLFFRKIGYRPFTKVRSADEAVVDASLALEDSGWKLSNCTAKEQNKQGRYGSRLLFRVPSGTKVKKGKPDADNWKVFILFPGNHKEQLTIWSGPLLGGGFTSTAWEGWFLDGSAISEKSDPEGGAMDVRGELPGGKRWRSLSWPTDIAQYHDVSADAARFFDQILDSGCVTVF
jgi:hypothetical protein